MPDQLKANLEAMSGFDLSDVRVHRNSARPAQLSALAYAQGNEIHLGPGQEQHLPHEAWHVVQQRQGRVRATTTVRDVAANDDVRLEQEADAMGVKAFVQVAPVATMKAAVGGGSSDDVPQQQRAAHRTAAGDCTEVGDGRPVIQAVWAYVNDENDEHLYLRTNGDGTYTHSATGRRFRLLSAGPPLIVAEIVGNASGGQQTTRPRDYEIEDEPQARRRRLISSGESMAQSGGVRGEQEQHAFTVDELSEIDQAETHRLSSGSARRTLYGDRSEEFRGMACWNWALSGGRPDAVNPSHLFEMLSNISHTPGGATYDSSFDDAWNRFMPRPLEEQSEEQRLRARQQQAAYEAHREQVRALWDRRRSLRRTRGRRRVGASSSDNLEAITNDAVRLSMQLNNLQPASQDESTPFSIAMARHPNHGVNWSHWGLEINGHSFETIPGWGLWHQQEGFEYWANQTHSIEDSQVTRVPLRSPAPGHLVGVRGQLNVMRARRGSGRTRSSRREDSARNGGARTSSTRGIQGELPLIPIAPGLNLDAGGMVIHYYGVIGWANAQGTYSDEFHWIRNHPGAAANLLQQGGMTAGAAQVFTQQFAAAVQHFGQQQVPYVDADMQMQILNTLGVGQQLLAVTRYLRLPEEQRRNEPSATCS